MSVVRQKQIKKRSDIIKNAIPLLQSVPFEEISVKDICEAANISNGSFYHYFNHKNDVLIGLLELIDIYMIENVFPLLTHSSEIDNIKEISRGFARHIVESGIEQAKLITSCRLTVLEEDQLKRPLWQKLVEIIKRGQQKKEISIIFSPERTADLLIVAMSGVAVDWSRRDGSFSLEKQMDDFTELLFGSM